jgi:uncharacterized Zn-binding protein involved in type VI secretion
LNGALIDVSGQPNQTIQLPLGLGKLVVNEQVSSTNGNWSAMTVNALHLYVDHVGDAAISFSHADIACEPPTRSYGGQGTIVDATVLDLTSRVSDTGPLPSWGGSLRSSLPSLNLAGLVTAGLVSSTTKGSGDKSTSNASAANVRVTVAGLTITTNVLKSNAQATCTGSTASVSGSSQVVSLKINNLPIIVTGQPNQVVPLVLGQLILNERTSSVSGPSGSIDVNAVHLVLPGIADIALSSSEAEIVCAPMPACSP